MRAFEFPLPSFLPPSSSLLLPPLCHPRPAPSGNQLTLRSPTQQQAMAAFKHAQGCCRSQYATPLGVVAVLLALLCVNLPGTCLLLYCFVSLYLLAFSSHLFTSRYMCLLTHTPRYLRNLV